MSLATEIDRFGGRLLGLVALFALAANQPDIVRPFMQSGPSDCRSKSGSVRSRSRSSPE